MTRPMSTVANEVKSMALEGGLASKIIRDYWRNNPSLSYRERLATGKLIQSVINNARYQLGMDEVELEVTMRRVVLGDI